jgi:signal peptidase I
MQATTAHSPRSRSSIHGLARLGRWLAGAIALAALLGALAMAGLIFAGYRPTTEHSNSMVPYLHRGDLIFSRPISAGQARVGEVITFDDPYFRGVRLTHRVRSIRHLPHDRLAFITKGDANPGVERWTISADGQVTLLAFRVPDIGRVPLLLDSHPVYLALAVALALWLLVLEFVWGRSSGGPPAPRPPRRRHVRRHLLRRLRGRKYVLAGLCALLVAAPAAAAVGKVFDSGAAGTPSVSLAVNDSGQPLFDIASMRPGEMHSACELVTNRGPDPADVGIYGASTGTGLQSYLELQVTRGTLSASTSSGSCAGFKGDSANYTGAGPGVIYDGPLARFPSSSATAIADPVKAWAVGGAVAYRMTVSLADNNAAQGLSAEQRFDFGANAATEESKGNGGGGSTDGPSGGGGALQGTTPPAGGGPSANTEASLLLACSTSKLALTNLMIVGSHVIVTGVTAPSYAHSQAKIFLQGSRAALATVTVSASDTFTASVPLPPARARLRAHYVVRIGSVSSLVLSLVRRLTLNPPVYAAGKLTISGTVAPPLSRPAAPVVVQQRLLCGKLVTLASIRPASNGSYRASFPAPAGSTASVFSAYTHVRGRAGSGSLVGTRSLAQVVALP